MSCTHSHASFLDSCHRLVDAVDKFADMLEVSGHLSGEHHVNDGLPQRPELVSSKGRTSRELGVKQEENKSCPIFSL